jgi:hypothetical protein
LPSFGAFAERMQTFRTRDYRLAACVFILVWALLTAPWLSGAVTIPYDAKALFHSQLQFLANAFHSGQSPWWNPNTFAGMPQIADPQSLIFSPAVLLAYFEKIPSFRELDTYVFILLALGGLAIFRLCQDRGWHPAGCTVAAIVFAFGASSAWRVQHIAHIQSLAYFAIGMWLLSRALQRSSVLYGVLTGIAAGMMMIEPNQVALLGAYVLAGICVAHWLQSANRRAALIASIRPLACAAAAAALLDAVPLLSTYLFLESSNRPEILFSEAVRGSLHPASLLTAVVPDMFGSISSNVDYWGPYSEWWDKNELTVSFNMSQMYVGSLPVLLLLTVGIVRGALWAREVRALAVDRKLEPAALKLVALTSDAFIYENLHALPRVLFATDWQRADFAHLTKTGNWPSFDPRRTVLLENAPARRENLVALAKLSGVSGAYIRAYENTRVVIDVTAAQPGFLVLHDLWHPWWEAEVDGREVPILRANVLFRAVELPAGRHTVTFRFKPLAGAMAEVSEKLFEPAAKAATSAARPIRVVPRP